MDYIPYSKASQLYTVGSECKLRQVNVGHAAFRQFSRGVSDLQRLLGESGAGEDWRAVLGSLRRFRYLVSVAPLSFSSPNLWLPEHEATFTRKLARADALPRAWARQLEELYPRLTDLLLSQENPLLDALVARLPVEPGHKIAVLIGENRLFEPVSQSLSPLCDYADINLLRPADLKTADCYDTLFCFGASCWLPEHVFIAPRARALEVLKFSWLADDVAIRTPFSELTGRSPKRRFEIIRHRSATNLAGEDGTSLEDVKPVVNWHRLARATAGVSAETEEVEARLYLLEDDHAVFLLEDDDASILSVDLEFLEVQNLPIRELECDLFILLRTQGGGDYVVEVADQLMGKRRDGFRHMQANWKRKLAARGQAKDLTVQLQRAGAVTARAHNVRNWLSSRNIRPGNKRDFAAIMSVIGKAKETEVYWSVMNQIAKFHHRAGFAIRDQLLKVVERADLKSLNSVGRMDFELPDSGGGTMSLFRIRDIAPEPTAVPSTRLGCPFKLGGGEWLA